MITREIGKMSDEEFGTLAGLVKDRIGLHLRSEKKTLVESRLSRRLRTLGHDSYGAYIAQLKKGSTNEFSELSNILTTNVTAFFRERHHFECLAALATASMAPRLSAGEEIRLWSAGCSTGAEPYSIAMTLHRALGARLCAGLRILATDIDRNVLNKAEKAVYSAADCEGLTDEDRAAYTRPADGGFEILPDIRRMISFRHLNLIEPWPMRKRFDVIFCRNVVIYFDAETQSRLWDRFHAQMSPDGHLFIGHSERLSPEAISRFQSVGVTAYRRI